MDDLTREEMQEYRGNDAGKPSRPSPYRDRTPEENDMLDMMLHSGERVKAENLSAVLDWYSTQQ